MWYKIALFITCSFFQLTILASSPNTEPFKVFSVSRPQIQEFNLPDGNQSTSPELDVLNESELACQMGKILLDFGLSEEARIQFAHSLDNLLLNDDTYAQSDLFRIRSLIILQEVALYRDKLDLYNEREGDATLREGEESPLDELADRSEIPPTIDVSVESFIEEAIRAQRYDLPITVNAQVLSVIQYLSNGAKKKAVTIGLERLNRYREIFQRIFKEEGLPMDLIYLGLVESNYAPYAYSRARAKGIWQFIEDTGRSHGLRIDWWVDERCDVEKSTRAACAYLKDLYAQFKDWYLVMAAYNSGENRIARILASDGDKTYWEMCAQGQLPRQTRGYVPAILAAIVIGKNPERFGLAPAPTAPLSYLSVEVPSPTDLRILANVLGVSEESLRELNPALRRTVTPPTAHTYKLNIPAGTSIETLVRLYELPAQKRLNWVEHRIVFGDSLAKIAKKYGVSIAAIREANGLLGRRTMLHPGQVLAVPLSPIYQGGSQPDLTLPVGSSAGSGLRSYRVRRGDTLPAIARRLGVAIEDLQRWNGLRSQQVRAGARLRYRLPRPAAPARSIPATTATAGPSGQTYTVARGDSFAAISRKFGVRMSALLAANHLNAGSTILPGKKLIIPGGAPAESRPLSAKQAVKAAGQAAKATTGQSKRANRAPPQRIHTVRSGDTIFSIARQYQVTVELLKKANRLRANTIHAGDQLVIPR